MAKVLEFNWHIFSVVYNRDVHDSNIHSLIVTSELSFLKKIPIQLNLKSWVFMLLLLLWFDGLN